MTELDTRSACKPTRVEKVPNKQDPYKAVVTVGGTADVIIKNLRIPDVGFRNAVLTVGAQVFEGRYEANHRMWHFPAAIPLFKMSGEPCYLTVYGLGNNQVQIIELAYDSYTDMPDDIKKRCAGHALVHGGVMYNGGLAF